MSMHIWSYRQDDKHIWITDHAYMEFLPYRSIWPCNRLHLILDSFNISINSID